MNTFRLFFIFLCVCLSLNARASMHSFYSSNITLDSIFEPNVFPMDAAIEAEITLETYDGMGYTIVWEEGVEVSANSTGAYAYTYTSPYSGVVRIEANSFNIKELIIGGGFAFDIQQLYDFAPRLQSLTINGGSTCYGNLASKPTSLTYIDVQTGEFYGNFNEERLKNVERLRVVDGNSISFDVGDFDTTIKYIGVTGNNTASGYIDSLNYPILNHFDVRGQNTITGDLGMMQTPFLHTFALDGNNTINQYTPGNIILSASSNLFIFSGADSPLSTEKIDALLIDLDQMTSSWSAPGFIFLTGTHESSSDVSAAARASLITKGATVATN